MAGNPSPSRFAAYSSPQGEGGLRHVAIIDVGKTNAKVSLVVGGRTPRCWHSARHANATKTDGPYPHLDATRHLGFSLRRARVAEPGGRDRRDRDHRARLGRRIHRGRIRRTTGSQCPSSTTSIPAPDEFAAEYDAARPPFSETLSPRLPGGLNLGAQFFWQERRFPEAFAAATAYVNYPQYWAWRLSGVAATEMCSMGAHSDMWNPRKLRWSSMVEKLGWAKKLAPLRPAFDRLGPIRPALAKQLGLDRDDRDPVRHPRFQRLAAAASEGAKAAVRGRLDRHLGDPLRLSAAISTGSTRTRDTLANVSALRRSGALRPLHGRARVRAPRPAAIASKSQAMRA